MTKKQLAELVLTEEELKHIDYALPENFIRDAENLLGLDRDEITGSYVWSYNKNKVFGEPLNLLFRFYIKYNVAADLCKVVGTLLSKTIARCEKQQTGNDIQLPVDYAELYHLVATINSII